MVIVRQQDRLVQLSNGDCLSNHMMQMIEHFVKKAKVRLATNCNHADGIWLPALMNWFDCITFGALGYDLIDFKEMKMRFHKNKKKIYHPKKTPKLEKKILRTMPRRFRFYYKKVHKAGEKWQMDDETARLWKQHLRFNKDKFTNIVENQQEEGHINFMEDVNVENQSFDESSSDINDENANSMLGMRFSDILQRLQAQTQSQFSNE